MSRTAWGSGDPQGALVSGIVNPEDPSLGGGDAGGLSACDLNHTEHGIAWQGVGRSGISEMQEATGWVEPWPIGPSESPPQYGCTVAPGCAGRLQATAATMSLPLFPIAPGSQSGSSE